MNSMTCAINESSDQGLALARLQVKQYPKQTYHDGRFVCHRFRTDKDTPYISIHV